MPPSQQEAPTPPGTNAHPRTIIFIVFATILIDFIGFSILIPVLPDYADRLGASAFEVASIVAVYALTQLLFLPAWGWFSDRFGRRPVILVSLTGTVGSFLLLAFAEDLNTIYVSRIFGGFFAASVGTAQAVITDVTPPSQRADGMGKIGAALGLAFVLGPALGGILADFSTQMPFYAVSAVAAINLVLAWFYLPETQPVGEREPVWAELWQSLVPTPIRMLMSVHDRRVGLYLYLWFHIYVGFAAVEGSFPLFLLRRYNATTLEVGLIFAWIGVFIAVSQGVLVGRLARFMKEGTLVVLGLLITGVGLLGIALAPSFTWLYVAGPVVAMGNGIAFPSFTSLYSQTCDDRDAGELLGQGNSMGIAGRVVGALAAGLLMDYFGLAIPFLAAGAVMFSAAAVFAAAHRILVPHPIDRGAMAEG
jgi:DHA1 family tetracycline resistance protein-like MFS transporter